MSLGDYLWSARSRFWYVTLAALLGVGTTLALGQWQLGRAATKQALQAEIDAQSARTPLDNADVLANTGLRSVVHRRASLRGVWLADATIFLDNRQMDARQGFFVLTPLRLTGSERAVMVQRGWVPRHFTDRNRLPDLQTPSGEVSVQVRMAPPPSKLYDFAGAPLGSIRQNIDLTEFASEKRFPIWTDFSAIELAHDARDGLSRNWPVVNTGVDKHHGYAFQWFGLSALIAGLYAWFQFIQPRRRRHDVS